jgi:hypothetical protein
MPTGVTVDGSGIVNRRNRKRRDAEWLLSVRGDWFGGACYDCNAVAAVCMDDHGALALRVFHSECCPAANGLVPWRHVTRGER